MKMSGFVVLGICVSVTCAGFLVWGYLIGKG